MNLAYHSTERVNVLIIKCLLSGNSSGALKGVMRVGVLAKGLLLHQRLDVDLVVLCHGELLGSFLFLMEIYK